MIQIKRQYSQAYGKDDADLLAVMDVDTGDAWLVPWGVAVAKRWHYLDKWDAYKTHVLG